MKKSILIVGSLNMDLVVRSPRHPQPGETIIGSDFGTFPGGKGANQAVAAARLGAPVEMIGRVGSDPFGDALLATVGRDGVSTEHISRDPAPTGVALITVDAAGQNTIVVASGANAHVSPRDVDAASPPSSTPPPWSCSSNVPWTLWRMPPKKPKPWVSR